MKKISSAISLATLIFCSCLITGCGDNRSVDQLLSEATKALTNRATFEQANQIILVLDEKAPADHRTLMIKALAIEIQNPNDKSTLIQMIDLATNAADRAPNDFEAQFLAGRLLIKHKEYDRAIRYLNTALKINPEDTNALVLLADAQVKVGEFPLAYRAYLKLSRLPAYQRSYEIQNQLGVCAFHFQKEQSIRFFEKALVFGAPLITKLNLARTYEDKNDISHAIKLYKEYIQEAQSHSELFEETQSVQRHLEKLIASQPRTPARTPTRHTTTRTRTTRNR